jgi:glutamate 5-kinase
VDAERRRVTAARRWVVKIGSALLTNDGRGLARAAIADWVGQIAALQERGHEIVLVSSGAIAEGMARLNWAQRPRELHDLQAAAAGEELVVLGAARLGRTRLIDNHEF